MRVLLVSIAFPPKRDPESLQVAKYCKFLSKESDITLKVVTSANPTLYMDVDNSLRIYNKEISDPLEIQIYENRYLNYLIRKINPGLLQYPDSKFTFWMNDKKVLLNVEKPDIIYSRSYPISSTILALKLKKRWDVPWVLHLSDPWAISSQDSLSPSTQLTGRARLWNKKKEEECFTLADAICLTSDKTLDLYKEAYPTHEHKFFYMPNVFDDDIAIFNPYKTDSILKFVYTGGFGEARSPFTLLESIRKLWINHPDVKSKVIFQFTGEMSRKNTALFNDYKYIPIIEHLGVIPYPQVIALQRQADVLINVDSDISDKTHAVFFPSKLLEYMAAQRHVIAITNRHSTTFEIVEEKLGKCFEFNEIDSLSEYFWLLHQKHILKDVGYFFRPFHHEEFMASHNSRRLAGLFRSLVPKS